MKRILISGYYGFDNAGDEAVLAGLLLALRRSSLGESSSTVLSINPARTEKLHNVPAMNRYKSLLPALAKCDLLISGGGSLLQDVTSSHGIFYYLAVIRIAQILGRQTMMCAQGIGPLTRARSRKLTAHVANRVDAITVRDDDSAHLLNQIGVRKQINVTADPALLLERMSTGTDGVPLLSMRKWHATTTEFESGLANALKQSQLPIRISPINMHGADDAEASNRILSLIGDGRVISGNSGEDLGFQQIFDQISIAPLVIGMRLHALIFATAAGVPSVALSYDPKINSFMNQTGQQDAIIDVRTAKSSEIANVVNHIWSERLSRSSELKLNLPKWRSLAQSNADIALNLH